MEVDGGATTITELPDLNPESIQIKPEFLDETDHVGFEDCKKEFGLENVPVSTELTNKETKHEGDWDMLEAEICEELIIKDEDEDISDINLALYSEDKTSKAGVLGANAYIDSLSAVSPKKEKIADQNAAGEADTSDASGAFAVTRLSEADTQTKRIFFKCDHCGFLTRTRFALARHRAQHYGESSKTCRKTSSFGRSDNVLIAVDENGLFKCLHPGCTFQSFNKRAFRGHHHSRIKKDACKVIKCQHCPITLTPKDLLRHILSVHKEQTEKCGKCYQRVAFQLKIYHRCLTENISFIKHMKNKRLSANRSTTKHPHLKKPSKDTYNCYLCSYSSNIRSNFIRHTKKHAKNLAIVKCKECDYRSLRQTVDCHYIKEHCDGKPNNEKNSYSQSFNFKRPTKTNARPYCHDNMLVVKCYKDGCNFRSLRYVVAYHYTEVHGGDYYNCKNCTYTAQQGEDYTKHCLGHKKGAEMEKGKKKIFSCRVCSFSSQLQTALNQHMVEHTIKANFLSCLYCPERLKSVIGLVIHSLREHPEHNQKCSNGIHTVPSYLIKWHVQNCRKRKSGTYKCQECSYITDKDKYFQTHRKSHRKGNPVRKCPYCDYRSTTSALISHLKDAHGKLTKRGNYIKIFKCKLCSYSTSNLTPFEDHQKTHIGNNLIKQCPHCDYKSTTRALGSHVKYTHGKLMERSKYYCKVCSYNNPTLVTLKLHEKTHLKNYPIVQCPHCEFKSTKRALNYHIKSMHTSELEKTRVAKEEVKLSKTKNKEGKKTLNILKEEIIGESEEVTLKEIKKEREEEYFTPGNQTF